jgi:hypothetical protein
MSKVADPTLYWAVLARPRGEVLTAEAESPGLHMGLVGVPPGLGAKQAESWLYEVMGVAHESAAAAPASEPIPTLLHHALTGLLFSHGELWDRPDTPRPCSFAFAHTVHDVGFGWVGDAQLTLWVDGQLREAQCIAVRDQTGREARAWSIGSDHSVQVRLVWSASPDAGAEVEAVWSAAPAPVPDEVGTPIVPADEAEVRTYAPAAEVGQDSVADSSTADEPTSDSEPAFEDAGVPETSALEIEPAPEAPRGSAIGRWLRLGLSWLTTRGGRRAPVAAEGEVPAYAELAEGAREDVASVGASEPAPGQDADESVRAVELIPPTPEPESVTRSAIPPVPSIAAPRVWRGVPERIPTTPEPAELTERTLPWGEPPDPHIIELPRPARSATAPASSETSRVPTSPASSPAPVASPVAESTPAPVMAGASMSAPATRPAAAPVSAPASMPATAPMSAATTMPAAAPVPGDATLPAAAPTSATMPAASTTLPRPAPEPPAIEPPRAPMSPPSAAPVAESVPEVVPDPTVSPQPSNIPAEVIPAQEIVSIPAPAAAAALDPAHAPAVAFTSVSEPVSIPVPTLSAAPESYAAPPSPPSVAEASHPMEVRRAPPRLVTQVRAHSPTTPQRPAWPSAQQLARPAAVPIWRRPWAWAIAVLALFLGGWLLGAAQDSGRRRDAAGRGTLGGALHAIGLGGPRFTVMVNSRPPGAWITVDGKSMTMRTPATVEVTPGEHTFGLSFADVGGADFTVRGLKGDRVPLDATLWGALEIFSSNDVGIIGVTIDGEMRGYAPLRVDSLVPGVHEVRFSGPGVTSWGQTVDIRVGETKELLARATASPSSGVLQVQASLTDEQGTQPVKGGQVWIDGQLRGVAPLTLDLPRGPHSVRLVYKGQQAPIQVIDLPGGNQRFAVFEFGLDIDAPQLVCDLSPHIPRDRPTVVSASLVGQGAGELREMWLHAQTGNGPWRRIPMTLLKASGDVVGVAVFPETAFDDQGRARYYLSAQSRQGDESFTEIRTVQVEKSATN